MDTPNSSGNRRPCKCDFCGRVAKGPQENCLGCGAPLPWNRFLAEGWAIFIDPKRVNIDDLLSPREQGKIVRVKGDPRSAVMFVRIASVRQERE